MNNNNKTSISINDKNKNKIKIKIKRKHSKPSRGKRNSTDQAKCYETQHAELRAKKLNTLS